MTAHTYDVGIIGGGPAGLSAAIWLGRYLRSVVLIDSGDPRNWETRGVNGYLGLPAVTPAELRARGRAEAERYVVRLVSGCVATVDRDEADRFRIHLEDGSTFESRRLLLAIGIKDVWPNVDGLDRCYGTTVHHCPDCDGYEARNKKTVVIASGRKAVGMALALRNWTSELVICTNSQPPDIDPKNLAKLDRLNIPVLDQKIVRLASRDGAARYLELEDGISLDCEEIYFAIGHYPADDLGARLGCERDEEGLIVVDERLRSSVPNVYAAGDIVPGPHLAVSAAAEGAVAALAIHKSLLPEELTLE